MKYNITSLRKGQIYRYKHTYQMLVDIYYIITDVNFDLGTFKFFVLEIIKKPTAKIGIDFNPEEIEQKIDVFYNSDAVWQSSKRVKDKTLIKEIFSVKN